ncbi:hypothetical protein ACT4ZD_03530 [Acinetobacter baumannii]
MKHTLSFTTFFCCLISGCTALDTMILGMPLARSITPDYVKNYKTPVELINAKKLNGENGEGGLYQISLNQEQIPYTYMSSLCKSQQGSFYKIDAYSIYGTYGCSFSNNNKSWFVNIQKVRAIRNDVYIKTMQVDQSFVNQQKRIRDQELQRLENYKSQQIIKERQKAIEYQKNILAKAPISKDIGATICKDTEVSEYTGMLVYGRPQFRPVPGAKVIASLESLGNENQNIKINIKGWLSDNGGIGSGNNVLYKQTPLESGRVIWDNKSGWYKCNY